MTKAPADPDLLDDLWYFDSVMSRPIKRAVSRGKRNSRKGAGADDEKTALAVNPSGQLPVSTDGDRSLASAGLGGGGVGDGDAGAGGHGDAGAGGHERPRSSSDGSGSSITSELVEKMEKGTGELSVQELELWMEKLGLEYTNDGAMIRRVPDSRLSSQQRLDFSEFVCVNRFIQDGRHGHGRRFTDAHMASLQEVFDLFDRDDNGLISPAELRGALAKLGLIKNAGE